MKFYYLNKLQKCAMGFFIKKNAAQNINRDVDSRDAQIDASIVAREMADVLGSGGFMNLSSPEKRNYSQRAVVPRPLSQ